MCTCLKDSIAKALILGRSFSLLRRERERERERETETETETETQRES